MRQVLHNLFANAQDALANVAQPRIDIRIEQDKHRLRLTLHEGRKREVKRMCAEIGHDVVKLRRTLFAGIEAGSLRPGQWRWLRPAEVAHLRRLVKLS